MAEQTPDDLYSFAEALVRQLVGKKRLPWNEHRIEDEIQTLFLAGWQVYERLLFVNWLFRQLPT